MTDKIMIVEDEEDIVTLLRYNLGKEGFETCSVTEGDKALNAIKINQPTLVLLDWMLPGISGIEICKQMRYDNDLRNVPVIMLTARGEEADKIKGLTIGADDYMTKPFSVPELIARVRALLRRVQPACKPAFTPPPAPAAPDWRQVRPHKSRSRRFLCRR